MYDVSGDLSQIELQTFIGGTMVKSQFINLDS